jgi:hypothetical protein
VQVTTGDCANCGSGSDHYIQFRGDQCVSNYYLVKGPLKRGATTTLTITIHEDVGNLQAIRLEAGGADGWMPVDSIVIKAEDHFSVFHVGSFYLDELPKQGATFYYHGHSKPIESQVSLFQDFSLYSTQPTSTYSHTATFASCRASYRLCVSLCRISSFRSASEVR